MKKQFLFFAVAALALASCSSENDVVQTPNVVEQTADDGAVMFDAYLNRGTTRAGQMGILTTEGLKESTSAKDVTNGFGVFGYYTNDEDYGQTSKPDFFYNQKVYYDKSERVWNYDPIKYWPNEFGTTAISEGEDKLTFFAYAPYVPVNVNTGIAQRTESSTPGKYEDELETGIIAITRNTAFGDPYVKYYSSFDPAKCVDLCFGVAKADFKSSVDGEKNDVKKGNPYTNVKKPKLSDRIHFDFKHALAQLNVQIDADIDQMSHGTNDYLDDKTRIFVREVTFEGFAEKGMLNLNSVAETADYEPKWVDLTGANEIKSGKVTIYDGRRDGREGQPNAHVTNENPQTLNTNIICNDTYSTNGVPATAPCNLFNSSSSDASVLVIPTTEALRVTIVYDVETEDENLAGFLCDGQTHGSSVENKITKEITLGGQGLVLKAGKKYTVNLHLGMNSVKFDASVTDWAEGSLVDVDLPVNAPIFEVSEGTASVNVPYNENDEFVFGINGFNGGEAVTGTETTDDDDMLSAQSSNSANASGLAKQTVKIAANTTVSIKEATDNWIGGSSSKALDVKFTQAPHPLELAVASFEAGSNKKINLKAGATPKSGEKWNDDGVIKYIKVSRNGTGLSQIPTGTPEDNEFLYTAPSTATAADLGYITVKALNAGDVYTIVMKAGDADEETITWSLKAGSVSFAPIFNDGTLGSTITIKKGENIEIVGDGTLSGVSSSYTDVASASSTTITTVAAGITTITATITDGKEYHYDPASASTTLVISQDFASGASGSYGSGTVKVRKEGGTGTIRITGMTPNAILKVEEPLNEMFESISFDQERVGTSGIVTVTYKVKNNTSSARSASFTVWHGSATPKGATITVSQQAGS